MVDASQLWDRATQVQPAPSSAAVLASGLIAFALVAAPATWRWVRLGVTTVHEGGHAVVAVLVGRRLQGIRLHSDTSGLTVSRGRPSGPGMIATLLAGYPAPALVGLAAAALLGAGYAVGLLWLCVVAMTVMLLWIRNAFGFLALAIAIAGAAAVSWWASPQLQSAVAYLLTWVLLLAAPRPILELLVAGRARSRKSDPDQLARLTHVPAVVWMVLLLAANLAALVAGAARLT